MHHSLGNNSNKMDVKNVGLGLQKVWFLEFEISNNKSLKTNTKSKQNVDFINQKMHV